MRVAINAHHMD